ARAARRPQGVRPAAGPAARFARPETTISTPGGDCPACHHRRITCSPEPTSRAVYTAPETPPWPSRLAVRTTASARSMRLSGKVAGCTCTWAPAGTTRREARRRVAALVRGRPVHIGRARSGSGGCWEQGPAGGIQVVAVVVAEQDGVDRAQVGGGDRRA